MNISKTDFGKLLSDCFSENGRAELINDEVCDRFFRLTEFMLNENEKYNLTAITEPQKIVFSHYLDCAVIASHIERGARCADVGCGAGFPTLPLAILRPDLRIIGIDSTAKRTAYVKAAAELIGLKNVEVITARAEDAARDAKLREKFDYALARAVANMRVLSELCLPLVRRGGIFLAMKGKNADAELNEATGAIKKLGGGDFELIETTLGFLGESVSRPVIKVKKAAATPALYPRPYAKIAKSPL